MKKSLKFTSAAATLLAAFVTSQMVQAEETAPATQAAQASSQADALTQAQNQVTAANQAVAQSQAAVDQQEATVAEAEGQLSNHQASITSAEQAVASAEEEVNTANANLQASQGQVDNSLAALNQSIDAVNAAQAELSQAKGSQTATVIEIPSTDEKTKKDQKTTAQGNYASTEDIQNTVANGTNIKKATENRDVQPAPGQTVMSTEITEAQYAEYQKNGRFTYTPNPSQVAEKSVKYMEELKKLNDVYHGQVQLSEHLQNLAQFRAEENARRGQLTHNTNKTEEDEIKYNFKLDGSIPADADGYGGEVANLMYIITASDDESDFQTIISDEELAYITLKNYLNDYGSNNQADMAHANMLMGDFRYYGLGVAFGEKTPMYDYSMKDGKLIKTETGYYEYPVYTVISISRPHDKVNGKYGPFNPVVGESGYTSLVNPNTGKKMVNLPMYKSYATYTTMSAPADTSAQEAALAKAQADMAEKQAAYDQAKADYSQAMEAQHAAVKSLDQANQELAQAKSLEANDKQALGLERNKLQELQEELANAKTQLEFANENLAQIQASIVINDPQDSDKTPEIIVPDPTQESESAASESQAAQESESAAASESQAAQESESAAASESQAAQESESAASSESQATQESESAAASESQAAQESESAAASESQATQESESAATSESQAAQESESAASSESQAAQESESAATSESQAAQESESAAASESQAAQESESASASESQATQESESAAASESQATQESESTASSESQAAQESESAASSESQATQESESTASSESQTGDRSAESESAITYVPAVFPTMNEKPELPLDLILGTQGKQNTSAGAVTAANKELVANTIIGEANRASSLYRVSGSSLFSQASADILSGKPAKAASSQSSDYQAQLPETGDQATSLTISLLGMGMLTMAGLAFQKSKQD